MLQHSVRRRVATAFLAFTATLAAWSADAAVVKDVSTGINPITEAQLANGVSDPDWVVGPGGDGGSYVGQTTIARSSPIPNAYQSDSASTASRWVAVNSGAGLEGISLPGARYNFQTNVDLTGFVASTASIPNGRFVVDDGIVDVKINGTVLNFPNGFAQGLDKFYNLPTNFGAGAFTSGVNTIVFELINNPGSPVGLRLEASVTATPTPEPSSFTAVAFIAGASLLRRRRSGHANS